MERVRAAHADARHRVVRCRVVHLSGVPEATGDRAHADEPGVRIDELGEHEPAASLGVEHAGELRRILVLYEAALLDAGTVHDAGDPSEIARDVAERTLDRVAVRKVDGVEAHVGAE